MRVSRAALLERTGPNSSGTMLSGFSHTLSSQIASASSPAFFQAVTRSVARCQRYCRISSADHLAQCNKWERRLVPAGALSGVSRYPPSSESSNPLTRSRKVRITATVCEIRAHQSLVDASIQFHKERGQKPCQGSIQALGHALRSVAGNWHVLLTCEILNRHENTSWVNWLSLFGKPSSSLSHEVSFYEPILKIRDDSCVIPTPFRLSDDRDGSTASFGPNYGTR